MLRNPRGAFTPHRLRCGDWVLLFYNNGQTDKLGYTGRLVVWLVRGRIQADQDRPASRIGTSYYRCFHFRKWIKLLKPM